MKCYYTNVNTFIFHAELAVNVKHPSAELYSSQLTGQQVSPGKYFVIDLDWKRKWVAFLIVVEDGQVSQACKVVYKIVAPRILLCYVRKDIARVNWSTSFMLVEKACGFRSSVT